jgi:beta-lactam-binding protein with PASTA domain
MNSRIPQLLGGRYEVGELIGRGGMAEVHHGYDTRLGRDVALKILRSDHLRDATFLGRFRREAQSVAGLSDPAIVAVYDSGEERQRESGGAEVAIPYIVMEFVDGLTLRQVLSERGTLSANEAARITEGVLGALDYSHKKGMVHRDIKPANVMITGDGAIKVMDFGIARAMADAQATMTQTSSVLGTAQYISPEQAEGQSVDSRSDLYSAGCLLFELLTGRTPFVGEPVSLTYQHVTKPPPLPSSLNPAVPDALDAIVVHALAKNRDDRYQDASAFRADLQAARLGMPISAAARRSLARVDSPGEATPADARGATAQPVAAAGVGEQHTSTWDIPREPDRPRSRRGLFVALTMLVAALAVLGVVGKMYLDSRPARVSLPAVLDEPYETAKARLELLGFDVAKTTEASRTVAEDLVVRQDPAGNTEQREGSLVTLTISTGPAATRVPNLTGKSLSTAQKILSDAGLNLGRVVRIDSRLQKSGRVVSSEPAAFADAHEGDTVDLTIASGRIDLPDLVGKTEDQARDLLNSLGLIVSRTSEISDEFEGTVIRQEPLPGKIEVGATVSIVVARSRPVTETTTITTTPSTSESSSSDSSSSSDGGGLTSPPATPRTQPSDATHPAVIASGAGLVSGGLAWVLLVGIPRRRRPARRH